LLLKKNIENAFVKKNKMNWLVLMSQYGVPAALHCAVTSCKYVVYQSWLVGQVTIHSTFFCLYALLYHVDYCHLQCVVF
jgi:hypothetical protein